MSILLILTTSSLYAIAYGVERLLETVADGQRRICVTFPVRVVFGAFYPNIAGLLGVKFVKNSSSYLVMVMITIFLFIAPVASRLCEILLAVDVIAFTVALIIKLFDGKE